MNKVILETEIQPKKVIENEIIKYVYTVEEFEQASVEFMESQGHEIDRDFAMDLIWADDEFTTKYPFIMAFNEETQEKTYEMTEEDMKEYKLI